MKKTEINLFQDSVKANTIMLRPKFINSEQINRLEVLCTIWGFLKYHHPIVMKGQYNWDFQLLHLIPMIAQAPSIQVVNQIIEEWLDNLDPDKLLKNYPSAELPTSNVKVAANYGGIFKNQKIRNTLKKKLAQLKYIPVKDSRSFYIKKLATGTGAPEFTNERIDYSVSSVSIRLLALFRYWNIIEYFYPYRYLIKNWDQKLRECIPEFINATTKAKYTLAFLKLIATLQDAHANIWGDNSSLDSIRGRNIAPFEAIFIKNDLVVVNYYKDTFGVKEKIHIGDIIKKINGVAVDSLVQKYLPYAAASNYKGKLAILAHPIFGWLFHSNERLVDLSIQRGGSLINFR